MNIGTVKNVFPGRNFGFIKGEDKKEYFFHRDDFQSDWDTLVTRHEHSERIPVKFEIAQSPKGPRATNVTVVP